MNLEVLMGQMVSLFSERQQGNLLSTSEVNPRRDGNEHFKAITLWSGKLIDTDIHAHENKGNEIEENDKNDETPAQNEKNNAETMGNNIRSLKSSVENTPTKVK